MSMNGGDAAETMVKFATNTAEVALRLVGDGATTLGMMILAMAQKTKERGEVRILSLDPESYEKFKVYARKRSYNIEHKTYHDKKNSTCEVLFYANDAAKVNMALEKMGYNQPQKENPAPEQTSPAGKKQDTPSGRSLDVAKDRPSKPERSGQRKQPQRSLSQSSERRESVKVTLERCKTEATARNAGRQPSHQRSRPKAAKGGRG